MGGLISEFKQGSVLAFNEIDNAANSSYSAVSFAVKILQTQNCFEQL